VFVTGTGTLTLSDSSVIIYGNIISTDSSSFYELKAGVLANSASIIYLSGCNIFTSGTAANGVFTSGPGN
jgi:hypothetical protein